MTGPDERRRTLDDIRARLAEALTTHHIGDDESELAMLSRHLDTYQNRLDELFDRDPLKFLWFDAD